MPDTDADQEFRIELRGSIESVVRLNREMGEVKTELTFHRWLLFAVLAAVVGQYFVK